MNKEQIRHHLRTVLQDAIGHGAVVPTRTLREAGIPQKFAASLKAASFHVKTNADADHIADEYAEMIHDEIDVPLGDQVRDIVDSIPPTY